MAALVAVVLAGCGTTRWTDTARTATEQLVIADAIDQAVSELDFEVLAGSKVYLDTANLDVQTHKGYLVGALRQQLLISGCKLVSDANAADYVVEARCGALGTDRHDLMFGMPQITIPSFVPTVGLPAQIPELVIAKKTKQIGVIRLAVYVYDAKTRQGVWQSGIAQKSTTANNLWILGAGPFERGPHRQGMSFAGKRLQFPFISSDDDESYLPLARELLLDSRDEHAQTAAEEESEPQHTETTETKEKPSETQTQQHEAKVAEKKSAASEKEPTEQQQQQDGAAEKQDGKTATQIAAEKEPEQTRK